MSPLLEVRDLTLRLPVDSMHRPVLRSANLSVAAGQALGLVGESGSGKSMTVRSIARLLPAGAQVEGQVRFDGKDVTSLKGRELRAYRGEIAVIFQDPRAHINPVRTIGDFLTEALRTVRGLGRREAEHRAISALSDVGIAGGQRRLRQYPHEFSGGMLQRIMIAAALLVEPRLLLADEPTTALDVTTQSEVVAIIDELRRSRNMALLFITHDLELASAVCDQTAVMYAGQIVELCESVRLHDDPLHPYTSALVAARPSIDRPAHRLTAITGQPLSAFEAPDGCSFAPRCAYATEACTAVSPQLEELDGGLVRCIRASELRHHLTQKAAWNG